MSDIGDLTSNLSEAPAPAEAEEALTQAMQSSLSGPCAENLKTPCPTPKRKLETTDSGTQKMGSPSSDSDDELSPNTSLAVRASYMESPQTVEKKAKTAVDLTRE